MEPVKIKKEPTSPSKIRTSPDKSKPSPEKSRSSPEKNKASPEKSKQASPDKERPVQQIKQEPIIEEFIERCQVKEHGLDNTAYLKYPGNYWNRDEEFDADTFTEYFKARIHQYEKGRDLEIDLVGLAPAIANAYRRIMIAEVPTMAIEHCFICQNTSVIQDEMLAHRLGMIPIRADPTKFTYKSSVLPPEAATATHSIVFELKVKCEKLKVEPDTTGRREDLHKNYKVYAHHLRWRPLGNQEEEFTGKDVIRPVHKNILIAKLADKQEIDITVHVNKGIGRDHAKFSPVATATYRLMPDIKIKEKVVGKEAIKLQKSFSKGVIGITGPDDEAVVLNARIDSGSRNVFRHANLKDKVKYDLIKDHFIFRVESTGAIPAIDILLQSCDILDAKCDLFLDELELNLRGANQSASIDEEW